MVAAACRRILEDHDASSALPKWQGCIYHSLEILSTRALASTVRIFASMMVERFPGPKRYIFASVQLLHDAEQINYLIETVYLIVWKIVSQEYVDLQHNLRKRIAKSMG